MQIQTGSCAVTNGDATVIASAGNDWSQATPNSIFCVPGVGAVLYDIVTVTAPGMSGSGFWEIELTVPWQGDTDAASAYAITKDFTPTWGFPILAPGDVETALLVNRGFKLLDQGFPAPVDSIFPGYQLVSPDADGTTVITPNRPIYSVKVDMQAGDESYTHNMPVSLIGRTTGEIVRWLVLFPASENPVLQIWNGSVTGTPIVVVHAAIGDYAYKVSFETLFNGAGWEICSGVQIVKLDRLLDRAYGGVDGGTWDDLNSETTTSLPDGTIREVVPATGAPQRWVLTTASAATNVAAGILRPLDYNAGTNPRNWIRI